ncbi:hypothetical protein [Brevundimonas viscosa]|uniref:Lipoprotein n=1 Tax=Brevundimonas viscosa TaxID=871741 RepID=A0A1I6PR94_9CAUL|nr:hypothetical protein [Brevundimonas viscosa]SFS42727.1 hypothetical protein SAMN05192570_1208 [Brevundimonas viscosa]
MRGLLAVAAVCAALGGCAGTGRLFSYGVTQLADARVRLGEAEFQIYVHPSDPTLLIQRSLNQTGGGMGTIPEFEAAAGSFLAPVGCSPLATQLIAAGSYETTYRCPPGVDLIALVAAQRTDLREGAPLRR